jgi:hypothetical protein
LSHPTIDTKSIAVNEQRPPGESLCQQRDRYGRHIGLSSHFEPILVNLSNFDARNESVISLGTLRKVDKNAAFIMYADDTQDSPGEADAMEAVKQIVYPHGPALIDLYFATVHPSFPIVQKHVFDEGLKFGKSSVSAPLLAGIYLLALNWWSNDEDLAKHPKPNADELESIASSSLAAAMRKPKLSTVQAGLLLLQRPEADSWSLTTQLVAIGQEIGLHLDCSAWDIPPWERALRKRIAWALYMQDKWSSLIHGRPSHIFSANWAVTPMTGEDTSIDTSMAPNSPADEEEEEELERGHAVFCEMIALTAITAEVMDTFYTQAAIQDFARAGKKATELVLERAKPIQMKLKAWFSGLAACLRMDDVTAGRLSPNGKLTPGARSRANSTGYLHLAYFATEITLHRRIIHSLNEDGSDTYLQYICRSAAKSRLISAMDFVNRLRPEHLQAFWYFPSKTNFTLVGTFGGLLWATAPAREEAEFYRLRLREYRWTLSVSSKRAEFLGYAVRMLDASRAMLRNLADKPSLAATQVSAAGVPLGGSAAESEDGRGGDVVMLDERTPPLTRNTSLSNTASVFSGFSNEALESYASALGLGAHPPTPPSSAG